MARIAGYFFTHTHSTLEDSGLAFKMRTSPGDTFSYAGLPADGTIAAEVAFMFNEWYRPNCCLEFPRGGSQAIVSGPYQVMCFQC